MNDLVILHTPNDPELDGRTMLVSGRTLSAERLAFSLRGYDAGMYSYAPQPVQMIGVPPLIDYRFTIPPTPANFIVWAQVPTVTSDGSVKTDLTVRADAPGFNVTDLRFRAMQVGLVLFTEVPRVVAGPDTSGGRCWHWSRA